MTSMADDEFSLLGEGDEEDSDDDEEDETEGNTLLKTRGSLVGYEISGGVRTTALSYDGQQMGNSKKDVPASSPISAPLSNVSLASTGQADEIMAVVYADNTANNNIHPNNNNSNNNMNSNTNTAITNNNTDNNCNINNINFNNNNNNNFNNNNTELTANTYYGNPSRNGSGSSDLQEETKEIQMAKALLEQAPRHNPSSAIDLDRSSVMRLAQTYITLQQGLRSWSGGVGPLEKWPTFVDSWDVTLRTQKAMGCFVLIITAHGTIVYVSEAIDGLLGHDQINLVGRSVQALLHPEELSVLATQFSLFAGTGQIPNSRSFYTRMLNVKRSGANRQRYELIHVIGHLQEVVLAASSDRTMGQKETWLMCACKMMSPMIEAEGSSNMCREWITHCELDGKMIYADSRSCQVTGYLPGELTGMSPYCFIHTDDQEHVAFAHNQALISANGASSTYRMYTSSHDLICVHTTMQLSRDKHTNRPKALFCLHRVLDEKEGKEQIHGCRLEVMRSKVNPARKFTMADIERTVKTLEQGGVASRAIPSKGGMMNSRLTDSCTSDGTDLLGRKLSQFLVVPNPCLETYTTPTRGGRGRGGYRGRNNPYQRYNHQQQQQAVLHRQNSFSPVSPLAGQGNAYNMKETWNHSHLQHHQQQHHQQQQQQHHQQQQQQHHQQQQQQHHQQQQQKMYRRHNSHPGHYQQQHQQQHPQNQHQHHQQLPHQQLPQQQQHQHQQQHHSQHHQLSQQQQQHPHQQHQMMSPPAGRSSYHHQMSVPSPAVCPSPLSAGSSTPRANSPVSFVDLLCEDTGPHSVPGPESHHSFHNEMLSIKKPLMPGTRGRGRGRARGRPRGSGRGGRGGGRGVGRPRGSRGGRGRGRGRGQAQLAQMREIAAGMKRSMSMETPGSYSVGSDNSQSMMGSHGGMMGGQMNVGTGDVNMHSIPSVINNENSFDGGHPSFQRMLSDDGSLLGSYSRDSFDFLDSQKNYDMRRVPSLELLSPQSNSNQDCIPPTPHTFKGVIPSNPPQTYRGGHKRSQTVSQDYYSPGMYGQADLQKTPPSVSHDGNFPLGSNGTGLGDQQLDNASMKPDVKPDVKPRGTLQHSVSFPALTYNSGTNITNNNSNDNNNNNQGSESDVEHSILGNLLKGSGGSLSSPGSKSPIQASLGGDYSPKHMGGMRRNSWLGGNPQGPDRGNGKQTVDCSSPFSPTNNIGNPMSKGQNNPGIIGLDTNGIHQSAQADTQNGGGARYSVVSEMQIFSDQLQHKHKSLEQSFVSQEHLLSHLESNMQQAAQDKNPESLYARLNARLDVIKANKAKQEKELELIKAKLELQVQQYKTSAELQQQQQSPFQSPTSLPYQPTVPHLSESHPPQPAHPHPLLPVGNHNGGGSGELQTSRHCLSSPVSINTRRMAIVPPIQRQMLEVETNLSPTGSVDLKGTDCLQSPTDCPIAKVEPVPVTPTSGSDNTESSQQLNKQPQPQLQMPGVTTCVSSSTSSSSSSSLPSTLSTPFSQPPHSQQQASSYSLHHHHHHHHYHHHHPVPVLTCQQQDSLPKPTSRQPPQQQQQQQQQKQQQKQIIDFPALEKISIPSPPYCPFDPFTSSSTTVSSAPSSLTSTSSSALLSHSALSISTSSLPTSLTSPIVCDTSPISVDESPSCASDTSSGYHSLSLSADSTNGAAPMGNQFTSISGSDPMGSIYTSKTGSVAACQPKKVMNSPELLAGPGPVFPPP